MKIQLLFTLIFSWLFSMASQSQPILNSHPKVKPTIFLDFDGHFIQGTSWNNGSSFYCQPSGMRDVQIENIFHRVAEDFRPFDVNVTTDSTVYLAAPIAQRIRIVVTQTSDWYPNVGGVAFTGSFTWGDDTPAFVFTDKLGFRSKNVAECISHETGHTLGLSHQARYNGSCTLVATYNDGTGVGETGWAPVMGNSYGRNLSGWNHGPTPYGCTQEQDNLSIITTRNGFTYRKDDHSDDLASATRIIGKNNLLEAEGIITTNIDKDAFVFELKQKSNITLDALPFSVGNNNEGANLDVKLTLLNAAKEVVAVYDPENVLHVSLDTVLNKGEYYILISGAGNQNTSNYGSLGSYTISAMLSPTAVLPISDVILKGKINGYTHVLAWEVIADEPASELILESATDGIRYEELGRFRNKETAFTYRAQSGTVYYRMKAISQNGQSTYSNVFVLKSEERVQPSFKVQTLVTSHIRIESGEDFTYHLLDMTGRSIKKGTGKTGVTNVQMDGNSNGVYFIQMIGKNQKVTQRIVRM